MSKEFLVGLYKEVGKNPDIIKIKNEKDYLERLVDGEYTTLDYDDYVIIYKKKSENLLANVYVLGKDEFAIFEDFVDIYTELIGVEAEESFVKGFSLANKYRDESMR